MRTYQEMTKLPSDVQRILVIGCAGSGKSTLSQKLGQILHLPVVHLDKIYWQPGWTPLPEADFDQRVKLEIEKPGWIMDGNYHRTLALRLARSDAVIYLDLPRGLCLRNVVKRRLAFHNKCRPDIGEGCQEKIDWEFLVWIWNFNKKNRANYYQLLKELDKPYLILRSPAQVKRFLAGFLS